jgi:hypothetical protein
LLALRKKPEQAPERHLHLQQYKDKSISAGYNPLLPVNMNDNQYGHHGDSRLYFLQTTDTVSFQYRQGACP